MLTISRRHILFAIIFGLMIGSQAYGQVVVTPNAIDFGNVNVGDTASRTVTIQNNTDFTISYTATITPGSDPDYSVPDGTGGTIISGNNATFDVFFSPTANGPATGSVTVVI